MGRLDMDHFNFTSKDEMRLLTAVEMGMKNHDLVPLQLIRAISGMKKLSNSGLDKLLHELSNKRLLRREISGNEVGFKLLVSGYDFLALKALVKQNFISAFGNQIGVGKESDVYLGMTSENKEICVKLHRLGRTSFRQIKNKRDYMRHRRHASWLYLSRLSAETEATLMQALHKNGYPVPTPIAQNRHVVLMEFIPNATPLYQVKELRDPKAVYEEIISILRRFLEQGLVHGDFNEFNLLISFVSNEDGSEKEIVRVIDFPQVISRNHPNAKFYYNRDAKCIQSFFDKRFGLIASSDNNLTPIPEFSDVPRMANLDIDLRVSGYQSDPTLQTDDDPELDELSEESCEDDEGSGGDDDSDIEIEEKDDKDDKEIGDVEEREKNWEDEKETQEAGATSRDGIKPFIGSRRHRGRFHRPTEPMSAEEVRHRVRLEVAKKDRKLANRRLKHQARSERVASGRRSVREDLEFGGDD